MAASTGSPASRKSTKRTPLTTRPSFTSRQGMTRTLNMESSRCRARSADKRQRRRGIEPAVVERAARDGTGELARPRLQQRLHIVDRRETARRNHRNGDAVGERDGGVEIEALEQAVAGNIGVDDRGDAGVG